MLGFLCPDTLVSIIYDDDGPLAPQPAEAVMDGAGTEAL